MIKKDSDFLSKGIHCAGWLFIPEEIEKPPVVIMAHGFAAERTFRLPAFAEKFVNAGLAAFLFDYRNFGDSDGEPRNLVAPARHLEDWKSAVNHVRTLREIDGQKPALWGSSFSGGHVLVTASRDPGISAVVAQVPFVDGVATLMSLDTKFQLSATAHGLRDVFRATVGMSPHYVPVVSAPDTFGLMNTPESKPGYLAIVPEGSSWHNEAPARIALTLPVYRPIKYVRNIKCPTLVVYAEKDSLIPVDAVRKTITRIPHVESVALPIGHFDLYDGEYFEKASEIETEFLRRRLIGP